MQTVKYGLREKKTGVILKVNIRSNDDQDYCNDTTVTLETYGQSDWLVDSASQAEYVRNFSTPWYNSSNDTPTHSFKVKELEVVEVVLQVSIIKDVSVPTVKEFFIKQYKNEPEHLAYVLKELESHKLTYSWYEYKELFQIK